VETLKRVRFVLWLILFLNIGVALAKVIFGYLANSLSMTADGFHSLSDGTSNVIGLIGVWIASKPADKEHPYGHRKFETFATMGIAALLLFVAYEVASGVLGRVRNPVAPSINTTSFVVMIVTLAINIFVYLYEVRQGRKLNSDFLVSDAYHTRSDILVSLSVIGGLVGVKLGWLWLDWVLGLVISVLIVLSAWEIVKNGAEVLCDAAVLDPKVINPLVTGVPGVEACHQIRSRGRSDSVYIDLHVEVDPKLTVQEAHDLAHAVEAKVKSELDVVEEVLVHVEPRGDLAD
jgi:cation diffusion facilitator family transporter